MVGFNGMDALDLILAMIFLGFIRHVVSYLTIIFLDFIFYYLIAPHQC